MKSSKPHISRSARTGRFVLSRARGEKISAVEGMTLTDRMALILDRSASLSGDERRAQIKEQVRRK